jgi:SAM-dependent methyltransferase
MSPFAATADFACRLCGGHDLRLYYTLGNDARFRYFRCADCTLVNYDLSAGLDQAQYTSEFTDPVDDRLPRNRDKDQSFEFLQRYVKAPGRLLDIGCGTGRLLHVAQRAGWQVKGVELSADMARYVAGRLGVEVRVGNFLEMQPLPGERRAYDVVCLRHVLEHLPDGLRAMRNIGGLLKPGGYLLVELPNVEALAKKWLRLTVKLGLHRRRFPDNFVAGHCNEYSKRSFRYLLDKTGYRLLRWETYSKKPLVDQVLNRIPVGTKARALAQLTQKVP